MSKAYRWTCERVDGTQTVNGEAHSEADARIRAEQFNATPWALNLATLHVEENPEYGIEDALSEAAPEVVGQSAADTLKDQDDKRVLAEANATMFHQLDAMKNKNIELENEAVTLRNIEAVSKGIAETFDALSSKAKDLQALVVAWNSEQHAKAQAASGEWVEPTWMELVRALI